MHIKRKTIGRFWPIQRTGTKYVAVPSHQQRDSVPLIVMMRDVLKIVKTKKEMKKILNEKKLHVNGKVVKEPNFPLMLFDTIQIPLTKKAYRVVLDNKRFALEEEKDEDSHKKIYRVIGKKVLSGNKIQVNLSHGKNILSNEKISTGDFVVLDNKKNSIIKIFSLKKDSEVLVVDGKHAGKSGKIKDIVEQGEQKVAIIKTKEGEVKANINNVFAKE
jgi:small subunit ribosomal protein S4e